MLFGTVVWLEGGRRTVDWTVCIAFLFLYPCACSKHYSLPDAPCRWAWQNPHVTKRIPKEQRITKPVSKSPKSKPTRRKPPRPPMLLKSRISNLHLLLRVPSFSRWPLQVRFYCQDVFEKWQHWNKTVDSSIRDGIKVSLDMKQSEESINTGDLPSSTQAKGQRNRETQGKGGVEGLDVGYSELKDHIEKSISCLAEHEAFKCAICAKEMGPKSVTALFCNRETCRTVSHLTCLATRFVEDEGANAAVTPVSGKCPGCKEELLWIDMVKELTLRLRGEGKVVQTMRKPREPSIKVPRPKVPKNNAAVSQLEAHIVPKEDVTYSDEVLVEAEMRALDASDESLPDDWHYQVDDNDEIMTAMSSHVAHSDGVEVKKPNKGSSTSPKVPAVIEDSDWDDADLLD